MSMINEQIKRLREKADTFERSGSAVDGIVKEFRQAADTIEELSAKLHNANMERSTAYYNDGWIPVNEGLPDDLEPVNITWVNHNPVSYYADIKDKPFTATGVYFKGQWYWWSKICTDILAEYGHNIDDILDGAIEVIAWMPLPESYKASPTRAERSEE